MAATTVHVSIQIYRGDPLDYPRFRHTSLFLKFANQDPSTLVHVVGPIGEFEFTTQEGYDPSQDQSLARSVDVGDLSVQTSYVQIIQILRAVSVMNHDLEFNCQTWVEAAIRKLRYTSMLANDSYMHGLDGMVNAIAEAEDEED